jgi:cellulose synthase/poly-beta-1,6-N-acetylglucosamine synthase-like glycosyltransferase
MELWLERILWFSVIMVILVTVGYPIFLALCWPFARRRRQVDSAERQVSLIIAAFNEEAVIARKIENSLVLDYPRERLEIIVASDGSTDRTDQITQSFGGRGVSLLRFPRTGKTGVQNEVARIAKGEVLVFSDANAFYRPDAIRKLVRHFADPEVACVCGQLVYSVGGAGAGAGASERSYWDYEKFMKQRESDLSSAIGANGSIYAVRRADYVELDKDLISDFVEPLALVQRHKRVIYEPEAISEEAASNTYGVEFRRKVRILTRSIRGLLHMRALLNPLRYGIFSFQLLMHKLLRFLTPLFLISGFASLAALAAIGRYRVLFLLLVLALAVAVAVGRGVIRERSNPLIRASHLLYYFLMVNFALVVAWANILRGKRMRFWAPERKDARLPVR